MVAVPAPTALTTPEEETITTDRAEECHVTDLSLASSGETTAVSVWLSPTVKDNSVADILEEDADEFVANSLALFSSYGKVGLQGLEVGKAYGVLPHVLIKFALAVYQVVIVLDELVYLLPLHAVYLSLHLSAMECDGPVTQPLAWRCISRTFLYADIHAAPWEQPMAITPHFTLEKRCCDLLTAPLPHDIDIVYFDAFAPEKQPEMWSAEIFARRYEAMRTGGVLTTYCAKGAIRRLCRRLASP